MDSNSKPVWLTIVADATIEALHHAVGLRVAWRNEAMLDLELLAEAVEAVVSAETLT